VYLATALRLQSFPFEAVSGQEPREIGDERLQGQSFEDTVCLDTFIAGTKLPGFWTLEPPATVLR
jgi:hypothetical protein